MPATSVEHRHHRRVECFVIQEQRERVPVWVFKPAGAADAIAGLVVNFSEGGLQVLTAAGESLDRSSYEIQLLLGEDEHVPRFRGRVTRVWTRAATGTGSISGFRFDDSRSSAEAFIQTYQGSRPQRRWIRCLLLG